VSRDDLLPRQEVVDVRRLKRHPGAADVAPSGLERKHLLEVPAGGAHEQQAVAVCTTLHAALWRLFHCVPRGLGNPGEVPPCLSLTHGRKG
jgi:hypothetical protein